MQWLSEHVRVEPGARIRFLEGVAFLSKVEDGYRYAAELFVALLCPRQIEVWLSSAIVGDRYPTEYNYGRLFRWLSGDDLIGSGCYLMLSRLQIHWKSQ